MIHYLFNYSLGSHLPCSGERQRHKDGRSNSLNLRESEKISQEQCSPPPVYQDISDVTTRKKEENESYEGQKHRSDPDGKETEAATKDRDS